MQCSSGSSCIDDVCISEIKESSRLPYNPAMSTKFRDYMGLGAKVMEIKRELSKIVSGLCVPGNTWCDLSVILGISGANYFSFY